MELVADHFNVVHSLSRPTIVVGSTILMQHMTRNRLPPLIFLFLLGGIESGSRAEDLPLEHRKVEVLVRELDSSSRKQRLQAERELIRRGNSILDQLPPPETKLPSAVREALLRIRTQVELDAALLSLRPSRVTLSGSIPLLRLLQELERQTANLLDYSGIPESALQEQSDVAWERIPYWEAVEEISKRHRLQLQTSNGQPLRLVPRPAEGVPPLALDLSGAIRIAWTSNRLIRLDKIPLNVRPNLQWIIEPRLRGLYATFRPRSIKLTADTNDLLPPVNPQATFEIPFGENNKCLDLQLDYSLPATHRYRTLRLEGEAEFEIAAGEERFEFASLDDAAPRAQRKGNLTVTFEAPRSEQPKSPDRRFTLLVRYDTAGPPFESHRLWIFHNRTFLKLPDGREIPPRGFETLLSQGRTVGLNYEFTLDPQSIPPDQIEKAAFVYIAPTRILTQTVPFRLSEVRFPDKD